MTLRIWGAGSSAGADGLASTAANWTGDILPGASDDIQFDGSVVINCRFDTAWTVVNMDMQAAYTGTIDAAADDLNHAFTGNIILAGTQVNMGDGNWTVGGNWDASGVTTLNENASTVIMTGTGNTISMGGAGGNNFENITIAIGATISDIGNIDYQGTATIDGTLTMTNQFRGNNPAADLQVSASGVITGSGSVKITTNGSISVMLGTLDVATLTIQNDHLSAGNQIVPATYASATVNIESNSGVSRTFVFLAGTYTFTGNVEFRTTATGDFTVDAATNNPIINIDGNLSTSNGGGNLTLSGGTSLWTIGGAIDFSAITTANTSTTPFTLSGVGSGTQDIDFNNETIGALAINDSGAIKQVNAGIVGGFTAASITNTAGTLDVNDQNITSIGAISNVGTMLSGSGTINVGGSFTNTGTFTDESGTLNFNASSGSPTFDPGGDGFNNITMDNSGVTSFILQGVLTMSGAFTGTAGKFDDGGFAVAVGDDLLIANVADFLTSTGPWTAAGTSSNISNPNSTNRFFSLEVVTATTNIAQTGDVYTSLFTMATASTAWFQGVFTLFDGGNFARTAGTFNKDTGKVQLDTTAAAIVSGDTTVNGFEISDADKEVSFTAGLTFTVDGAFVIQGTSGKEVVLKSTTPTFQYQLTANGTIAVNYCDVTDCDSSLGTVIAAGNSIDGGNTLNWKFGEKFSLNFDGSNDFVTIGSHPELVAVGTGRVCTPVRFRNTGFSTDHQVIWAYDATDGATVGRWQVRIVQSDDGTNPDKLEWILGDGSGSTSIFSNSAVANDSLWHHVVPWRDANGDMHMLLDNVVQTDSKNSTENLTHVATTDCQFGRSPTNGGENHFEGNIKLGGFYGSDQVMDLGRARNLFDCELSRGPLNIPNGANPEDVWELGDGDDIFPIVRALNTENRRFDDSNAATDGIDEGLRITHKSQLNVTNKFTIQVRFNKKITADRGFAQKGKFFQNNTDEFSIRLAEAGTVSVSVGGDNIGEGNPRQVTTAGALPANTDLTYTVVYNGANSNSTRLINYVDGVNRNGATIGTIATTSFVSTEDWTIAAEENAAGNLVFTSEIDIYSVIMWNDDLSAAEVVSMHNGGDIPDPKVVRPAGLVVDLRCGQRDNTLTLEDRSGQGNTASMENMEVGDITRKFDGTMTNMTEDDIENEAPIDPGNCGAGGTIFPTVYSERLVPRIMPRIG